MALPSKARGFQQLPPAVIGLDHHIRFCHQLGSGFGVAPRPMAMPSTKSGSCGCPALALCLALLAVPKPKRGRSYLLTPPFVAPALRLICFIWLLC